MPSKKKDKTLSFEQSLEELENMVESMESGQLPLEDLISNYERGANLISHCETVLDDARKRLELLTLKPSTSGDSSDQNLTLDAAPATHNNDNNDDDEIRLF